VAKKTITRRVADEELPDDSLEVQDWAYRLVAEQMRDVARDRGLKTDKRRDLILRHATALVPLMPRTRLAKAEQAVRGEADKMSDARTGPEMEDASQFTGTGSTAAARRGRPRKRSTL
jgi:hypothetical protein